MKRKLVWPSVALAIVLLVGAGCTSARLEKSAFEGRSIAVTAAYPPAPQVRHPLMRLAARGLPTGRMGDEYRKLKRLQTLLDGAAEDFDLPGRLAADVVRLAVPALGARPASSIKTADYVLDLRVYDYGLTVNGPVTNARFYIEAEARVYRPSSDEVVWKERLSRISRDTEISLYGTRGYNLTQADLDAALDEFAAFATERMQKALQKDIR